MWTREGAFRKENEQTALPGQIDEFLGVREAAGNVIALDERHAQAPQQGTGDSLCGQFALGDNSRFAGENRGQCERVHVARMIGHDLVVFAREMEATLTDAAIVMFDKMLGGVFRRADQTHKEHVVDRAKTLDASTRALLGMAKAMLAAKASGADQVANQRDFLEQRTDKSARDFMFYDSGAQLAAVRYKNWKFTYYGSQPGATGWLLPLIPYLARTEAYVVSRRERKKVEILFAHLKRILRLDRLRLRGPNGAKDEFLLAALRCMRMTKT